MGVHNGEVAVIISHTYKFAIVCPPKTGSTTLHEWLIAPPFCDHHWPPPGERQGQHEQDEIPDGYTVAVSWRHPFDREVSLWAHSQYPAARGMETSEMTFVEFVEQQPDLSTFYSRPQISWVDDLPRLDYVIRLDHIEEDVRAFPPIAESLACGHVLRPVPMAYKRVLNPTVHDP